MLHNICLLKIFAIFLQNILFNMRFVIMQKKNRNKFFTDYRFGNYSFQMGQSGLRSFLFLFLLFLPIFIYWGLLKISFLHFDFYKELKSVKTL